MLDASFTFATFACQALLLFYPAWRLAGRRLLAAPLYVVVLLYASAGVCWFFDRYNWPLSALVPLLTGAGFLAHDRFRLRRPVRDESEIHAGGDASSRPLTPLDPRLFGLLALVGGAIIMPLFLNLRAPPTGWDAMTYHIEFPLQWLAAGRLGWGQTDFGDLSPPYYPALSQLWYGWWLLPGGESSRIADATGVFWWLICWLALRELVLARRKDGNEGAGPERTLFAELLVFAVALNPYLLSGVLRAGNDLMLATFFALAWLFLRERKFDARRYPTRGLIETGLACGALVAVKYSGAVYLIALILSSGFARWRLQRAGGFNPPRSIGWCGWALIGSAFLAGGGWWYARNLLVTGNPIYPGEIRLPGTELVLFAGYYTTEFFAAHPFHKLTVVDLVTAPAFAPTFALCFLLALWLCLAEYFRSRLSRKRYRAIIVAGAVTPLAAGLFFWFMIPLHLPRLLAPVCIALLPALVWLERECARSADRSRALLGWWILSFVPKAAVAGLVSLNFFLLLSRTAELYGNPWVFQISLSEFTRASVRYGLENCADVMLFALLMLGGAGIVLFLNWMIGRAALGLRKPFTFVPPATAAAVALIFFLGLLERPATHAAFRTTDHPDAPVAAWKFWNEYASPGRSTRTLGLVGTNALAPFRGADGQGRIVLMTARSHGTVPLHERPYAFQSSAVPVRAEEKRDEFWKQVETTGVDAVFVKTRTGVLPPRWHPQRDWLKGAKWKLVFGDANSEIYVRPNR